MEFSVLDKQTLQCVMTEAEIADYGMDKHMIYQNDARTADFFRQVMQKAQQETGFVRLGKSIAVHAAFLSDESLEITFLAESGEEEQTTEQTVAAMETAILKSKSLIHLMDFCKKAPAGLRADLFEYQGIYFLLADVRGYGVRDTALLFHMADEFVDTICYTKSITAFIKEHGRCITKDAATVFCGI